MKRVLVLIVLVAATAGLLFAAGSREATSGQVIRIRYAHVGVDAEPQTRYARELAELVRRKTEGRIDITVFPNSQLGNVSEMVDGVAAGTIGMGHHDFASLGKFVEDMSVFNAPFIYRDNAHSVAATNVKTSPLLRDLNEQLIARGRMRVLGSHFRGARQLSATIPIYTPDDIRGQKIRGVPLALWMTMLNGMGAIPTPVEITELHTALLTGVVIGQENPLTNIYAQRFYEVQKYIMMTSHMHSVLATFINEQVWRSIPERDQALFLEAIEEMAALSLEWARQDEANIREKLEAEGMTFITEADGLRVDLFRNAVNAQLQKDFPGWSAHIARIQQIR